MYQILNILFGSYSQSAAPTLSLHSRLSDGLDRPHRVPQQQQARTIQRPLNNSQRRLDGSISYYPSPGRKGHNRHFPRPAMPSLGLLASATPPITTPVTATPSADPRIVTHNCRQGHLAHFPNYHRHFQSRMPSQSQNERRVLITQDWYAEPPSFVITQHC